MLRLLLDGLCERGQPALVSANVLQVVCGVLKRVAGPVVGALGGALNQLVIAGLSGGPATSARAG
jgi:hypothetical protein